MNTIIPEIKLKEEKPDPAVLDFLRQVEERENEKASAIESGMPSLHRLVSIARGDTGQCITVRRFLLGLYNGHRFPFELTTLRGLDKNIYDDVINVINLDARATLREIHQYIDNGGYLFESWAATLEAA